MGHAAQVSREREQDRGPPRLLSRPSRDTCRLIIGRENKRAVAPLSSLAHAKTVHRFSED